MINNSLSWATASHRGIICASHPAAWGLNHGYSKIISLLLNGSIQSYPFRAIDVLSSRTVERPKPNSAYVRDFTNAVTTNA